MAGVVSRTADVRQKERRRRLVAKESGVAEGDDVLDVLGTPARVRYVRAALTEPLVDLEVLLFEIAAPVVLLFEEFRIDVLETLVHLLGVDVEVFAPVIRQVVERL